MREETKVVAIIVSGITAVLVTLFVSISWYYISTHIAAINAGYSQQSVQGNVGVYWVKDGKKLEDSNER